MLRNKYQSSSKLTCAFNWKAVSSQTIFLKLQFKHMYAGTPKVLPLVALSIFIDSWNYWIMITELKHKMPIHSERHTKPLLDAFSQPPSFHTPSEVSFITFYGRAIYPHRLGLPTSSLYWEEGGHWWKWK